MIIESKIKNALISIGFSESEVDDQIKEAGEIIIASVLKKLLKEKSQQSSQQVFDNSEDFNKFLLDNFSKEEIRDTISKESGRLVKDYIEHIIENMNDQEKQKFYDQFGA